jgi:glucan phosphoethanolaminetransferase (alkaline phosphatase superfamily)
VFKHLDDHIIGGKLARRSQRFFDQRKLDELRARQVRAVRYLDSVVEELFDLVPRNTYITITSDHGELFGEDGYFGHGPIQHEKVFEVPFVEGKLR